MKKIFICSFIAITSQLHSISLKEYIKQHTIRPIRYATTENTALYINDKNLTDLTGLQNIPDIDQVRTLSLSNNQLQTLPENIFNGLDKLELLYLHNNNLETLPEDIFDTLPNLQSIYLNGNPFKPEFISTLITMLNKIPQLELLNGEPKDIALSKQPFSTLKYLLTKFVENNIDNYRHKLHTLPEDVLDLFSLT